LRVDARLYSLEIFYNFFTFILKNPINFLRVLIHLIINSKLNFHLLKNIAVIPKSIWMANIQKEHKVDHVHVHWAGTTASSALISSKITGVNWSLTCHRWDIYENNLLELKSKNAKFVRFISRKGMEDAFKNNVAKENAVILPMGVRINKNILQLKISRLTPVILCAANLIEIKGHKYLIEAISILKKEGLNVKLLIAGDGPLKHKLICQTEDLNIAENIEFLGNIEHKTLIKKYENNEVDLFILPSVDLGYGQHEGVPVSLMEAMSYGIPVISTKTGSIEELIDESFNLTVVDKSANNLANKISELITNSEKYDLASRLVYCKIINSWSSEYSARELKKYILF
jgi:glycosyltransferase involved in cell wall biosynthesis